MTVLAKSEDVYETSNVYTMAVVRLEFSKYFCDFSPTLLAFHGAACVDYHAGT